MIIWNYPSHPSVVPCLFPVLQINLSGNKLCGVDAYRGIYTAEGIKAIAAAIGVSPSLTQVCPTLEGGCTLQ